MSACRYLVVVQDARGYPTPGEDESQDESPTVGPVIHKAVLAEDFEAMESRALAAEERESKLHKALLKHGRHFSSCPRARGLLAACRCGLRDALADYDREQAAA